MRTLLLTTALVSLLFGCQPAEPAEPPSSSATIAPDEGGSLESPDGNFAMAVPGQSLVSETTFTITERPASDSFDPEVTLSNIYEVEAAGDLAIVFRAELAFTVSAGEVDRRENLGVAHGEVVGQDWDEVIAGSFDAERGAFIAETVSLSYFALVDDDGEDPPACACDTSPGCDADCGCDEDCGVEPGLCDASCMQSSGAVCCESCGECNAVEVQCQPVCGEGTQWDCELQCCFDQTEFACAG